ncbi:hypothetical protein FA95DRAFT_1677437 [Auriscalpium vulgare]|uniref:Uncharacterized protein n=1 Tax=Auriscalpium vulgare TaxID=40419 RepID=A0ACB8RZI5_9AGAM|nr:hypothetical protein FA95DRAFT_1677437 [Auriscalpium vulgare]
MSSQVVSANAAEQAVQQSGVLFKLILFSLSLGVVPLSSYFLSEKYVWSGNSTFAAITAIVAANVVLVTYIILSLLEDKQEQKKAGTKPGESRKER